MAAQKPKTIWDDIIGLIVKAARTAKKEPLKRTSVNLHGSPMLGLKKILPFEGMEGIPYMEEDIPAVWTQKIAEKLTKKDLEEILKTAQNFAEGNTRGTALPEGTGAIYGSKIPEYDLYEGGYGNWAATTKPVTPQKEITLAGKTEAQRLKELEKYLRRQGIRIK